MMNMRALSSAAPLVFLVTLTGCAVLREPDIGSFGLEMPAAYEYLRQEASATAPDPAWWAAFDDPTLNALEVRAMQTNNALQAGLERVIQSRATLRQSGAAFLPQITAGETTTFSTIINSSAGAPTGDWTETSSARLSASYELDLFGRNRASLQSARAALAAQIYNQRALELSVQSDVANLYFNILSLQQRLDTARRNLDSVERVMALVQRQYDEGAVSGFDLSRQRSAVATARARIPQLEEQLAAARSSLAILLGVVPQNFEAPTGDLRAILPPPIAVGLPSELLTRRPDLMAAEASLVGARADIGAARAAFLPTLDLSAGLNAANIFSGGFLDDLTASLGGGIAATIFSGGRLEAGLERSESRYRELLINYHQSVLSALKEVDDALMSLRSAEEREELQQIAAEEAQRAFDLSEARYEAGADGLLAVLDAQRTLLDASDSLVQARQARLNAAIGLFAALGGGWQGDAEAARLAGR